MTDAEMHCVKCGMRRPGMMRGGDNAFTSLMVAPRSWRTGVAFASLQEALDVCNAQDIHGADNVCLSCSSADFVQTRGVSEAPQVLAVELQQWSSAECRTSHDMLVNDIIVVGGCEYVLRSVIFHMGSSARSGHWVCVARDGGRSRMFWVYDDALRQGIRIVEMRSAMDLRGNQEKIFYAAGFIYDRCPAAGSVVAESTDVIMPTSSRSAEGEEAARDFETAALNRAA